MSCGKALVLHPSAVVDLVAAGSAEPFLRAQLARPFAGLNVMFVSETPAAGTPAANGFLLLDQLCLFLL
jgi:hypothetical protein